MAALCILKLNQAGIISSVDQPTILRYLSCIMSNSHFQPRTALLGAALLAALAAGGCTAVADRLPAFLAPYRPDIQQGNVITQDMVEQVRPGMSRDQVRFMLGTPMLADVFHQDRWDYTYYLNRRGAETQVRKLTVRFADNKVARVDSDPMPAEALADTLILGRKPKDAAKPPPREEQPQITLPAGK